MKRGEEGRRRERRGIEEEEKEEELRSRGQWDTRPYYLLL